jgi:carbon storage regulator
LLSFGPQNAFRGTGFELPSYFKDERIMLVLTRKIGEAIIIDGCIRVTVSGIKGDKVRIGIDAPPEVRVDREEIHRRLSEFAEPALSVTAW